MTCEMTEEGNWAETYNWMSSAEESHESRNETETELMFYVQ